MDRDRILVRLTALLHDTGHAPFSHAAEDLFPPMPDEPARRYRHEDYSAAIIRHQLREAIEQHPLNDNYRIRADEIANLLERSASAGRALVWGDIISGQMDADRIDYLLRDSLHAGVQYGRFDWRRLMNCLVLVPAIEEPGFRVGVTEGGLHAAESLVLARYLMFTQVYFHKTRVAYDHHLHHALAQLLPAAVFPSPDAETIEQFLQWDDWRVLGALAEGRAGEHGRRLRNRNHFREVYHTRETPTARDLARFDAICKDLGALLKTVASAEKSWYKVDKLEIPVRSDNPGQRIVSLSKHSTVVAGLKPIDKRMAYCSPEDKAEALAIVVRREGRNR